MGSARGTVDYTYRGKRLTLRPDMQAIEDIEEGLDCSIVNLGIKASQHGLRLRELKIVIWAGLCGHFRGMDKEHLEPTLQEVGEYVFEKGIADQEQISAVAQFLVNSIATTDEIEVSANNDTKKKE